MQTKAFKSRLALAQCLIALITLLILSIPAYGMSDSPNLFGYNEARKDSEEIKKKWTDVLDRTEGNEISPCDPVATNSQLKEWDKFLLSVKGLSRIEQIHAVNKYANNKTYRLDKKNYGKSDYWATPKEFLARGGDCEDYAIFKLLSLQKLGFDIDSMRIVILIDTDLRTPHAVLAVYFNNDILILDNQSDEVRSHLGLSHYTPIYSVNEKNWWMHSSR